MDWRRVSADPRLAGRRADRAPYLGAAPRDFPTGVRSARNAEAVEETLGDFDERQVCGCGDDQVNEEQRRRRDEAKPSSEREQRKDDRGRDGPERHGDEEVVWPAAKELT